MADNDNLNDEYEFSDLDVMNVDPDEEGTTGTYTKTTRETAPGETNVRRNALIAVVVVVLAMLAYKFFGGFFTSRETTPPAGVQSSQTTGSSISAASTTATPSTTSNANIAPADNNTPSSQITSTTQPVQQPADASPASQPVADNAISSTPAIPQAANNGQATGTDQTVVVSQTTNSRVDQRLASMELSQQNLRSDLSNLSSQLSTIGTNINDISNKINALNQSIDTLSSKLEEQVQQLVVLKQKATTKKIVHQKVARRAITRTMYYIQAIIPGRAWLISTNGSTLTVREGTNIIGYGVVKLIDPTQGRVVTSSGRVIRFSQQDS